MNFAWMRPAKGQRPILAVIAAALAAAMAVALAAPASAQDSSDVYTVSGVPVDATGASATEARDIALAEGRVAAAQEMLRRLTLYGDWPMLPEIDGPTAESMVSGVGVANERSSATRYLADMTVRFQPQAVRSFLRQTGVRFTDNQAATSLLLPVLDTPGVRVLFDEPNPWRAAWEQLDLSNSLVPLVLPLGDLSDLSALSATEALSADWAAVETLAARYGADQVMVAHARRGEGAGLDVTLTRITPSGSEAIERSFGGATLEEAVAEGATGIRNALIAAWKTDNAVAFGLEQTLPASVEFASLSEWLAIRQRLAATSIVQGVDVVAVSPTGAQIEMRVAGPAETVAASVGQRQLRLVQEDGYWALTLGQAAAPAPMLESRPPASGILAPPSPAGQATEDPARPAEGLPADEAIADRLTRQQQGADAP